MLNRVSIRTVMRELPEIGVGLLIALGIGMTVIALFFALVEVVA